MKWMKERDLLIAQTMAFVQSVKGKLPDAELLDFVPDCGREEALARMLVPLAIRVTLGAGLPVTVAPGVAGMPVQL